MIKMKHWSMPRTRASAALAMAVLVTACGTGGHVTASGHTTSGHTASGHTASAAQQTCQQLDSVLSDGPDPGADALGYAEAQILPLKQIHAANPTLGTAISTLAGAYQSYYAAHGTGSTAKSALNTAINRINALCPGAGATA